MKRASLLRIAAVFIAAILMSMLTAWAQTSTPSNTQTTSGSAGVAIGSAAGDQNTGGLTTGSGVGSYQAADPSSASGSALASGAGATVFNPGPTSANSESKISINILTNASGGNVGTTLGATGTQGNWSTVGDNSPTFATAGNTTTGTAQGSLDNTPGSVTGNGQVTATGSSSVTANGNGSNDANSSIESNSSSKGQTVITAQDPTATPVTSSGVSGLGVGQGQSVAGDPSGTSYAVGSNTGGTSYNLTTTNGGAQGQQKICGKTNSTVGPGTTSASSVIQSSASASSLP